jgi:hypothetical protein
MTLYKLLKINSPAFDACTNDVHYTDYMTVAKCCKVRNYLLDIIGRLPKSRKVQQVFGLAVLYPFWSRTTVWGVQCLCMGGQSVTASGRHSSISHAWEWTIDWLLLRLPFSLRELFSSFITNDVEPKRVLSMKWHLGACLFLVSWLDLNIGADECNELCMQYRFIMRTHNCYVVSMHLIVPCPEPAVHKVPSK